MALGYIAAFSETLALAVIAEKGLAPLCAAVAQETEDHLRAAAAWSLGQVGRHTPDHAKAVADTGALALGSGRNSDRPEWVGAGVCGLLGFAYWLRCLVAPLEHTNANTQACC
jgi:hypothetical protein